MTSSFYWFFLFAIVVFSHWFSQAKHKTTDNRQQPIVERRKRQLESGNWQQTRNKQQGKTLNLIVC